MKFCEYSPEDDTSFALGHYLRVGLEHGPHHGVYDCARPTHQPGVPYTHAFSPQQGASSAPYKTLACGLAMEHGTWNMDLIMWSFKSMHPNP